MFDFFLENDGYGEQKTKMKNTKKMQSSSHGFRVKSSRS